MIKLVQQDYGDKADTTISITIPEDESLTVDNLFAYFLRFTEMLTYEEGSWDNVLARLGYKNDKDVHLYDWAFSRTVC